MQNQSRTSRKPVQANYNRERARQRARKRKRRRVFLGVLGGVVSLFIICLIIPTEETHTSDVQPEATAEIIEEVLVPTSEPTTNEFPALEFGSVLDLIETPYNDRVITVIKVKVNQSYNGAATIRQNYYNIEDLIENKGFDKCDELQYWAVTENNGEDVKIFSCDLSKSTIEGIALGNINGERIAEYVDNLWTHPGLQ